jgi:hypothetical protein
VAHISLFATQASYAELIEIEAGRVPIESLQLCAMSGRQQGEYYVVEDAVQLFLDEEVHSSGRGR